MQDRPPRATLATLGWYAAVLVPAAVLRWLAMLAYYRVPNSDQAIVGLMARHIGEHPVFYWGQSYDGTLEVYITAAVFKLWGQSFEALHVAPIAFSLVFLGATMWIGHSLYGRKTALLTGLFLAPGPALLMRYSVWPGYNYLQAMAFGSLALAVLLPLGARGGWWRLPLAAYGMGLALWAQPLAATYGPALLAAAIGPLRAAWRDRDECRGMWRALWSSALLLPLGLWPSILFNVQTRGASLRFLISRPEATHSSIGEGVTRLVEWAGPVLIGVIPPNVDPANFMHVLRRYPFLDPLAVAMLSLGAAYGAWHWRAGWRWLRTLGAGRPAGEGALLVLAVTVLIGYLFSTWSSARWSAMEPRYLLPLYTLTPLLVRALFPAHAPPWRLVCGGAPALLMIIGGFAGNGAAPQIGSLRPLAARLEASGAQVVYGDYWEVYRLAFVSDERLLPVVTTPHRRPGLNRYAPYLERAARATDGAWVVQIHSRTERALRACLARHHLAYGRFTYTERDTVAVYARIRDPGACLVPW